MSIAVVSMKIGVIHHIEVYFVNGLKDDSLLTAHEKGETGATERILEEHPASRRWTL
jgi:hypothetical protein